MSKLRAGDLVEVRTQEEILTTLGKDGCLDGLPFMPEMLAYCGKRFRVWKRAHKTCDTVNRTGGRRMTDAVHLEESRCNGEAHGGCGAGCLLFWKEAWLKPIGSADNGKRPPAKAKGPGCAEQDLHAAALVATEPERRYACQATKLPGATTLLHWWDVRQYLEDYRSGNVPLKELAGGAAYVLCYEIIRRSWRIHRSMPERLTAFYDRFQAIVGGVPYPRRSGRIPAGQRTPAAAPLLVKPGDLVRVKRLDDVLATLDTNNKNRGLFFDAEEVPYCGKHLRVRSNVTHIIDERTGKMLSLNGENVLLEGAICNGWYSDRRMFCPRAIFSIWRTTWVDRADGGAI